MLIAFVLIIFLHVSECIWPPELKLNLVEEEEFVISDPFDSSEIKDIYEEEEYIKKKNKKMFKLEEYINLQVNEKKTMYKAPVENRYRETVEKDISEFNAVENGDEPWIGGIIDEGYQFRNDYDMFYGGEGADRQDNIPNKNNIKRESDSDYNYEYLKEQYEIDVKKAENSNETVKYKETEEEGTVKGALHKLVDIKAKNCSEEEKNGIGIAAVRCFWIDMRNKHLSKDKKAHMIKKIIILVVIWIGVYLAITLPLWCQYGWCCCCCKCKFCQPREEIEEIKTFLENNPPGIFYNDNGELIKYEGTLYERYAYKDLEKAILRL